MGTSNNIWVWAKSAGSNSTADAGINWAEGQAPSTVNDSARGMMAAVANWRDDTGGVTTTGSANAYSVTTNSGFTALASGLRFSAKINATNTSASTLNVDGLGAKAIRRYSLTGEQALSGSELQINGRYDFIYDAAAASSSGGWIVLNPTGLDTSSVNSVPAGAVMPFAMSTPPSGWLECNGAAVSRTTYATLFAAIGTTFGVGNGSTTFNIPDLRGEWVRGWSNGRSGVDTGRAFGSTQSEMIGPHTHTGTTSSNGAHTHNINNASGLNSGSFSKPASSNNTGATPDMDSAGAHTHTFTTDSNSGTENRVRNVALMYCIRT